MNKLYKYNQILIAVVGTLFFLALIVVVMPQTFEKLNDKYTQWKYRNYKSPPVSNLGNQLISFGPPEIIDEQKLLYLIPVFGKSSTSVTSRFYINQFRRQEMNIVDRGLREISAHTSDFCDNIVLYDGLSKSNKNIFNF